MREIRLPAAGALSSAGGALDASVGTVGTARPAASEPVVASNGSIRHTTFRLGTTEPPAVTVLKELLGPSVAVASLAACMWADGTHLSIASVGLAVIVFLVCERVLSTPDSQMAQNGRRELHPALPRLLLEWSGVFVLLMFLISALRLTRFIGSGALTAWFFLTPAALLISNSASLRLTRWWGHRRATPSRHIIIGATEAGIELAKRVQQGSYSGKFLGFFDFRDRGRLPVLAPDQWAGSCGGVADFVRSHGVDAIYIALPISSSPRIVELLEELRDTTASIYLVPANIFEFDLVQPRCVEICGIPALAVCETPHQGMSGLRKRLLDIVLATVLLMLAGPLMLLIAAAVKLSSPGPVLFRQRRYGLGGEDIFIYKFRSMTVCEDGPSVRQATRDDIRTTPVGRLLRRTSMDELPQILNVLQGKMSFVGPRPHAIAHNEMYRKLISGYMIRHKVRPGITGWAQINGLRGETETLDKMRRRIEYDIEYLNNWSIWLDLKILVRTLGLLLRDEHAY